jgi:hypothetical protein
MLIRGLKQKSPRDVAKLVKTTGSNRGTKLVVKMVLIPKSKR